MIDQDKHDETLSENEETKDAAKATEDTVPNAQIDSITPGSVEKSDESGADQKPKEDAASTTSANGAAHVDASDDSPGRAPCNFNEEKKAGNASVAQVDARCDQVDLIHYVAACRAGDAQRINSEPNDVAIINSILDDAKKMGMHEFVAVAESLINKARFEINKANHVA